MKRIRTIFVALMILLVSMTTAVGVGMATPIELDVGTELPNDVDTTTGDNSYGTDGDPDDGVEIGGPFDPFKDDKDGQNPYPQGVMGVPGLDWSLLLDLLVIQNIVLP